MSNDRVPAARDGLPNSESISWHEVKQRAEQLGPVLAKVVASHMAYGHLAAREYQPPSTKLKAEASVLFSRGEEDRHQEDASPLPGDYDEPPIETAMISGPDTVSAIRDHAGLFSLHSFILGLADTAIAFLAHPQRNDGEGVFVGDYADEILNALNAEAETLARRAARMEPEDEFNAFYQARIRLAHALAYPSEDRKEAISQAASNLAAKAL